MAASGGAGLPSVKWGEVKALLWILVVAPWIAWLVFHPLEHARIAGDAIAHPAAAGAQVARELRGAYQGTPVGLLVRLYLPPSRAQVEEAVRRVPVGEVTSRPTGAVEAYLVTLQSDKRSYAAGDVAVMTVALRPNTSAWRQVAAPSAYWSASITDPRGGRTTYHGGLGIGTPALNATIWTSAGVVACPPAAVRPRRVYLRMGRPGRGCTRASGGRTTMC